MMRRVLAVMWLLATTVVVQAQTVQAQPAQGEVERLARFKAVFVLNFAEYVTWPAAKSEGPFVIGVLGESPLLPHLTQAAAKRSMGERPISVQVIQGVAPGQMAGVHLLVVGDKIGVKIQDLSVQLAGKSTLTVTDAVGAARQGSCINFILVDGRLKFEVNPKAVSTSGLKMSSHLLRLATLVE